MFIPKEKFEDMKNQIEYLEKERQEKIDEKQEKIDEELKDVPELKIYFCCLCSKKSAKPMNRYKKKLGDSWYERYVCNECNK